MVTGNEISEMPPRSPPGRQQPLPLLWSPAGTCPHRESPAPVHPRPAPSPPTPLWTSGGRALRQVQGARGGLCGWLRPLAPMWDLLAGNRVRESGSWSEGGWVAPWGPPGTAFLRWTLQLLAGP